MRFVHVLVSCAVVLTLCGPARSESAGAITYEERVRAQETIERAYYSNQSQASLPFEEAVPRGLIEAKVRKYLKESVALQSYWKSPITDDALQAEMMRIVRETRLPGRLTELFHALDDDPRLIRETLGRAALADRLARGFFAEDQRIHAEARAEALRLHGMLLSGELDPWSEYPRRKVVFVQSPSRPGAPTSLGMQEVEIVESSDEVDRLRGSTRCAPGPILERANGYGIQVPLEAQSSGMRIAEYLIPRKTWDEWWSEVEPTFDESLLEPSQPIPSISSETMFNVAQGCVPDDTWRPVRVSTPPPARNGHTALWTGSLMIVWGGWGEPISLNTGGRYDPLTSTWTPTSLVGAPSRRSLHTAIWTGTEMVVWGGQAPSSIGMNTGGRYDPVSDSWRPVTTLDAPAGRYGHSAVWTGAEMIVWGGFGPLIPGGRYDPARDAWTPITSLGAPTPRSKHTAVWTGDEMLIWGGSDNADHRDPGARYDPLEDRWRPMSTVNEPARREFHVALWDGQAMFIWGGDRDGSTGGLYDPVADAWSATETSGAPTGIVGAKGAWSGEEFLVWGGCTSSFWPCATDTGGRYDPRTRTWRPITTMNSPSARVGHSMVWTGSLMIVHGGRTVGAQYLEDGARYDPRVDAWTPTMISLSPSARSGHTAVWTGNEMVVWGGQDSNGNRFKTGARYDPMLDLWSQVSVTGSPTGRTGHSAVWSGTHMLVWGGSDPSIASTGGKYDPISDSWTSISTVNAPTARSHHSAVWTGSRMIVWGGLFVGELNTGGRYDPVSDTWLSTPLSNAPSARYLHSAVWTGSRMIVWGGTDIGYRSNLATGGLYNPDNNTWVASPNAGAPLGRSSHAAVWTGESMLVWGGMNGSTSLHTGGRFHPSTNSWSSMSPSSSPRASPIGLWTGQVMLIWGGGPLEGPYVQTGARYDPVADSWLATSLEAAPEPRAGHSSIWTGAAMIVWGGRAPAGGSILGTGGIYALDPTPDEDGDGVGACEGDCDDLDPSIHPGAVESCDGRDDDCDGGIDEELGDSTCGEGACRRTTANCVDGSPNRCVPGSPQAESCNGADDDCDGTVDDDMTPGTLEVEMSPPVLWPPNHRMVQVNATMSTPGWCSATCSGPTVRLIAVSSSEPDDADDAGDGNTEHDIQDHSIGSDSREFRLRAERDGEGNGRTYVAMYSAVGCSGESVFTEARVVVPHDQDQVIEPLLLDMRIDAASNQPALSWSSVQSAWSYNVIRGRLSRLRAFDSAVFLDDVVCLARRTSDRSLSGSWLEESPPVGDSFYYMVEYFGEQPSGYGTVFGTRELIPSHENPCD